MREDWSGHFRWMGRQADGLFAIGVVGLLLLLIIPLPSVFLDTFLCLSIVFSMMVLLLALHVENALEFSAFPSVLLFLTLFRLGLNVASTRLILTKAEAGAIIHTFGEFVIQGSEIVGLILFFLLTLINFFVVTKGAGRVAEVAARFTLEALPGKQMAIDSELTAGLISQKQAKVAHSKLGGEIDFYGAMDGASKFVKGDALIGLLIVFVNIIGGLVVGLMVKGMTWQQSWSTMARLTIGDGLVSQIPALLTSIGAAVMVTRSSQGSLNKMIPKQLFHQPKVLIVAASMLLLLSFMPGMPRWIIVPLCGILFLVGYFQLRGRGKEEKPVEIQQEASFLVSPLEIQLGYQAISMARTLQERVGELRQKITAHLGIRLPSVHISDQVELPPTGWAILVKGVKAAAGRDAELTLIVKKFREVVEAHAHELLNRQDIAQMLQEVKGCNGAVVEELVPKKLSMGQILKILQSLLKERVPIRDFVSILEILADHAVGEKSDLEALTESVRQGLAGKISQEFFGKTKSAHIITLDPKVEQMLTAAKGELRPKVIDQLAREVLRLHDHAKKQGVRPVMVTVGSSRIQLKRILEKQLPHLPVLSYKEITADIELSTCGMVSNEVLI